MTPLELLAWSGAIFVAFFVTLLIGVSVVALISGAIDGLRNMKIKRALKNGKHMRQP